MNSSRDNQRHRVVIIGGGFGGLYAAKSLRGAPVDVTLIDRRNFHLFQPLLYQVATGGLSPGDIASPLRGVLSRQNNATVVLGEVTGIDRKNRQVVLADGTSSVIARPPLAAVAISSGLPRSAVPPDRVSTSLAMTSHEADAERGRRIPYDFLIVATGTENHYFGRDEWAASAPGLKGIEDAIRIRTRLYRAFEEAEIAVDPDSRRRLLTFLVVGGGPTGVELAGAMGEIAHITLRKDFRSIHPEEARIILIEAGPRILPAFPERLADAAARDLKRLGVEIRTSHFVTEIDSDGATVSLNDQMTRLDASTVIWSAGVRPTHMGALLVGDRRDLLDKSGRVLVEKDLSLPGHPEIFVIGDLANFSHQTGSPLPGVAPVAMSEGRYVARLIADRVRGRTTPNYHYRNKGNLAVIGRASAVADFGWLKMTGYPAWLLWLFVHLMYLVEFDNRLLVFVQWAWNYFTRNRGARLITYSFEERS